MKRILAILAFGFAPLVACQVPPASPGYGIALTATPPVATGNWAGCTASAPCTYAFYAETITGAICDATTSANYKEITNPAARPTTPNFTEVNSTGLTQCFDVETVQGGENSGPSNVVGPVISPGIPLAPALSTPAQIVSELEKPNARAASASQRASSLPMPKNLKVMALR